MVKDFLMLQYSTHGKKYFSYLFGSNVASLLNNKTSKDLIEALSSALVGMQKKKKL